MTRVVRAEYKLFPARLHDAIIISDIHLGSPSCQAKPLIAFLQDILHGRLQTRRLILNGDVFDSIDFRRLKKSHWKVLSLLRKLSDMISITWVSGNHDGPADDISDLLGVEVRNECVIRGQSRSILVLHGDIFDEFIEEHPQITWFADLLYRLLQHIDKTHRIARKAKRGSKIFLRCTEKLRERALEFAERRGMNVICCGHTHHAEAATAGGTSYYNSGCWTESPCTYLTIYKGEVALKAYAETPYSPTVSLPALHISAERLEALRN